MNLIKRLNNFLEKQKPLRLRSRAEAEAYGIKLPPEEPEAPKAPAKFPKIPKPSQAPKATFPKPPKTSKTPGRRGISQPGALSPLEEVGRQLTPKGPYRSPEDIAEDVRESKRLAGKARGLFKPKTPSLSKQIEKFVEKQYKERLPGDVIRTTTHFGKRGKPLKPYLKYGGKILPREEVEKRRMGIGEGPRRK